MGLRTPCAGTRPGAADPTAQQSCVPATAPRAISERLKVDVWRVEKRGLEGPKSKSGGSQIEAWRASGRPLEQLGAVWTILKVPGSVLEASWSSPRGALGAS